MGSFLRREKLKIIMLAVLVLSSCSVHKNGRRDVASTMREVRCSNITVNKQYRADRDGLKLLEDHLQNSCDPEYKFSSSVIKEKGVVTGYLACCTPNMN